MYEALTSCSTPFTLQPKLPVALHMSQPALGAAIPLDVVMHAQTSS